jgi:hypothetical protein
MFYPMPVVPAGVTLEGALDRRQSRLDALIAYRMYY